MDQEEPPRTGVFRPILTRDAEAERRRDQPYTDCRRVSQGPACGGVYEIRFDDDEWMLVASDDLRPEGPSLDIV